MLEQITINTSDDLIIYNKFDTVFNLGLLQEAIAVIYIVTSISRMEAKLIEEALKNGRKIAIQPSTL